MKNNKYNITDYEIGTVKELDYAIYRKLKSQRNKAERTVNIYNNIIGSFIFIVFVLLLLSLGGITYPY